MCLILKIIKLNYQGIGHIFIDYLTYILVTFFIYETKYRLWLNAHENIKEVGENYAHKCLLIRVYYANSASMYVRRYPRISKSGGREDIRYI